MKDSKPEKKISSLRLVLTLIAFVLAAGIMVLAAVNIRHLTVDNMMKTLRSWFGMEQPAESFHYSGDGYLLNAVLNDDGTRLAAIKLTADGSRIVEYTLDSEEEKSSVTLTEISLFSASYT